MDIPHAKNANRPTQITYLINTFSVGGAERGMARLLSGLPPDRFDVTVIGLATRGGGIKSELPDHVTVRDLAMESPLDAHRLRTVWQALGETDVLVTSLYHATQLGRIFGTLRRVSVILSWQHNERLGSSVRQRLFGLLSPFDTSVLADSEAAAEGAISSGVPPQKVHRVPIAGIDVGEYRPVSHETAGRVIVGTVGRLSQQKNMEAVLEVADELRDEPIEFRIAGDGPQYDDLERRRRERNLDNVQLLGFVDSVPEFLEGTDIYFQPSLREGLCITVVEAMAAGLPIVASEVGGITETVVPGETGVLAKPSAIGEFAAAIREFASDPEQRAAYGAAGRQRVADHYSQERLVESFQAVLADQ